MKWMVRLGNLHEKLCQENEFRGVVGVEGG